jgi:hypothetical protein
MTAEHKERAQKLVNEMLEMVDVLTMDENVNPLHPAVKHLAEGAVALDELMEQQ